MHKILLNCDQVFDILTRGPFPAGEPTDDAVEQHLRACHDCRCLAEALRPAVTLLHEAITTGEASGLPEYQGALTERISAALSPSPRRSLSVGMRKLAPTGRATPQHFPANLLSAVRLSAAAVLVASLGILLYGFSVGPSTNPVTLPMAHQSADNGNAPSMPTADGLLQLASLRLPAACFPSDNRPRNREHAALLLAAMTGGAQEVLHCCTECHHASASVPMATVAFSVHQHCHLCHRG